MPKVIDLPTATTLDSGDYLIMEESSGGTKKITADNALTALQVGYTPSSATADVTTVPNSTVTKIAEITLPKGKWIVSACVRFTNTSGNFRAAAAISLSSTGINYGYGFMQMSVTSDNTNPAMNVTRILNLSASTTIYLVAFQSSGSSLTIPSGDNRITAIKIA